LLRWRGKPSNHKRVVWKVSYKNALPVPSDLENEKASHLPDHQLSRYLIRFLDRDAGFARTKLCHNGQISRRSRSFWFFLSSHLNLSKPASQDQSENGCKNHVELAKLKHRYPLIRKERE
jgi:hypothetical protein